MMKVPLILALAVVFRGELVAGGGTLLLQLVEFNNPNGEGANGHCCDGKWSACQSNGCDHYFRICITDKADLGEGCGEDDYVETDVVKNQNQIQFTGDKTVSLAQRKADSLSSDYTVRIEVWDKDTVGDDDYVDTLTETLHLFPEGITKMFNINGRTEITGTIWYKCDDDYYDCATCGATGTPRCSEYCKPFDSAHGACDQHGNLICDQGWTGEECTEEITTTTTTTATTTPPPPPNTSSAKNNLGENTNGVGPERK